MEEESDDDILEGTTRKVFRFVYRQREPVGIHDVQRGLDLSSPSVADYHLKKLLRAGLVTETGNGYQANRIAFENLIRIRNRALPLQMAYSVFFLVAAIAILAFLRPSQFTSLYMFSLIVALTAFGVSAFEAYKVARESL